MCGNIDRACIYVLYCINTLGRGLILYIPFNYLSLSDCVFLIR